MFAIEKHLGVQRRKVSDEVKDALIRMIHSEELCPGDRLPAERDMAQRFGVSRTTLRDAIRNLELLGYLDVKQGDGSTVRRPDGETLALPFRSLLETSPQLASDLLEFRRLLEPQIAALAAKRRTMAQVRLLEESLERQERLADAGKPLTEEDVAFHSLIAQSAGNTTVLSVLATLQSLLHDLRTKMLTGDQPYLGIEQHRHIARAIINRTEEAAHDAMLEHLLAVEASIIQTEAIHPNAPLGKISDQL